VDFRRVRLLVETTGGHGLAPALMGGMRERLSRFIEACHEAIRAAAGPLLRRAQDAGAVRADVELTDLLSLTTRSRPPTEDPSEPPASSR
jgi:hypothetical protein